jgi:hypothetical protein
MPMVPPRLLVIAVHALLHDRPFAVVGHEEPVRVEIETILNGGAVDFGDKAARAGEPGAVETDTLAQHAPRLRAPMTLVVMPEECQSIPMTAPNDWNQNG